MTTSLSPADLWCDICTLREHSPLVHSITNLVVINFNANVLLAMGASPVMAHAHEEVADMVKIAQSLVLNIGTLDPYWVESMRLALQAAKTKKIPVVFDPVGAGASPYRNHCIESLLQTALPNESAWAFVLRGNASEIMSVAGANVLTRGVDSAVSNEAANEAVGAAKRLVQRTNSVVCVSGATDHIVDNQRWAKLGNGHEWMTRITGVGCSASALVGAFCAVQPDAWRATVAAMAYLGVVGEVAAEQAQQSGQGLGRMQSNLLDGLQLLDQATFTQRLRMELVG